MNRTETKISNDKDFIEKELNSLYTYNDNDWGKNKEEINLILSGINDYSSRIMKNMESNIKKDYDNYHNNIYENGKNKYELIETMWDNLAIIDQYLYEKEYYFVYQATLTIKKIAEKLININKGTNNE